MALGNLVEVELMDILEAAAHGDIDTINNTIRIKNVMQKMKDIKIITSDGYDTDGDVAHGGDTPIDK